MILASPGHTHLKIVTKVKGTVKIYGVSYGNDMYYWSNIDFKQQLIEM